MAISLFSFFTLSRRVPKEISSENDQSKKKKKNGERLVSMHIPDGCKSL